MRKLATLWFVAFGLTTTNLSFAASQTIQTVPVGREVPLSLQTTTSGERTYVAYIPQKAPLTNASLVVVLHGTSGNGTQAIEKGNWKLAADRHGFIVLAPEGLLEHPDKKESFRGNRRAWNGGLQDGSWASTQGIDDVGFLRTLITTWTQANGSTAARVASSRVYITGFSGGAGMTFRAGAELSDIVAAIAPVSNGLLTTVTELPHPTSLLLIWGLADPLNPIDGGTVKRNDKLVMRPSAESSWQRWSTLLGCRDQAQTRYLQETTDITISEHLACRDKSKALFYRIAKLGHQWPGGKTYARMLAGPGSDALNATETIWAFFESHQN
jgi:polyhydroxybutyrate depolymerase